MIQYIPSTISYHLVASSCIIYLDIFLVGKVSRHLRASTQANLRLLAQELVTEYMTEEPEEKKTANEHRKNIEKHGSWTEKKSCIMQALNPCKCFLNSTWDQNKSRRNTSVNSSVQGLNAPMRHVPKIEVTVPMWIADRTRSTTTWFPIQDNIICWLSTFPNNRRSYGKQKMSKRNEQTYWIYIWSRIGMEKKPPNPPKGKEWKRTLRGEYIMQDYQRKFS